MKILVFGHYLEIGGTQVNAIEVATTLRDVYGHDVTYAATPGPMLNLVRQNRLRYLPLPAATVHPSPARIVALRELLRRERPDVVHAWDRWQCLDAYYVAHLWMRTPLVVTDMSMNLHRVLPKSLPTTFGTGDLVDRARAGGRRKASLLLPPVDLCKNAPGAVDSTLLRRQFGLRSDELTLAIVCRLEKAMKAEGVFRTIDAIRTLGRRRPLRLVIAGDGNARAAVERLARDVNASLGRAAVAVTGPLLDPRPLYAAADIVIGMGGSGLRGMAFNKPVVIVGENGFSAPLAPETADFFLYYGIYGKGDGDPENALLTRHIRRLAEEAEERQRLGDFGRHFVERHFDLKVVTAQLETVLCGAASEPAPLVTAALDGVRTAAVWAKERQFLPDGWRLNVAPLFRREPNPAPPRCENSVLP